MKLLIAIPVHNEQKYVRQVLQKVRSYHDDVLVVDDGSTDGTSQILGDISQSGQIHLIRHRTNQGYGQSLIDAFAFADRQGYDWVITMDCDEQHEPEMIPQFRRLIEADRYDVISGSRYLRPRSTDDLPPADRRGINTRITALLNRLFDWQITDAFCGFKAHRVAAMRRIRLNETGYAFPLQLWPQVWSAGLRVTELPVRLIYNDATRTFGGNLDDADRRLKHYMNVLSTELTALSAKPQAAAVRADGIEAAVAKPAQEPTPSPIALSAICGCGV